VCIPEKLHTIFPQSSSQPITVSKPQQLFSLTQELAFFLKIGVYAPAIAFVQFAESPFIALLAADFCFMKYPVLVNVFELGILKLSFS
jgi:hypothetical protein